MTTARILMGTRLALKISISPRQRNGIYNIMQVKKMVNQPGNQLYAYLEFITPLG